MRNFGPTFALLSFLCTPLAGCDSSDEEPDLGLPKTKSLSELKQESKSEMSKEELEEARRQAGFKSPEEQRAEALAEYTKSEKEYVKGHLKEFRGLVQGLRKRLAMVEKAAKNWLRAKKPEAAFEKFKEKYKESIKEYDDSYDEVTKERSRGGDTLAELEKAVRSWQDLNNDLSPDIAEAEGFEATLTAIREQLDKVEAQLEEIAKDDTIEADTP